MKTRFCPPVLRFTARGRSPGWCVGLAGALLAVVAHASDRPAVGHVKTVKGEAFVTTDGQAVAARPGTPLHAGSVLSTRSASSMGVVFGDNTLMSFGPDTVLTVDEFLYEPGAGKLKLGARMGKGTLNYVSGAIARLQPDAVTVKTPSATIDVRGTQFLLKVDEP